MPVDALSSTLVTPLRAGDIATDSKARKASTEFEGVLLSSLLSQLQTSFQLPGIESEDPAGDTMRNIGMQELGKVWANSGGIGLARMVLKQIVPHSSHAKDSSGLVAVPIRVYGDLDYRDSPK